MHTKNLLIQPSQHGNHVFNNVNTGKSKARFYSSLPNFDWKLLTLHLSIIILMCHLLFSMPKGWTFEAILAV